MNVKIEGVINISFFRRIFSISTSRKVLGHSGVTRYTLMLTQLAYYLTDTICVYFISGGLRKYIDDKR